MKTRRSYIKSNYECDQYCDLSIQSVLFPIAHNRSKKTIVPETPVNYNATNNTIYAASVLETPDELEFNQTVRNNDELCLPIAINGRDSGNESITTDTSFLETTPDLKLTNKKGIISILESEYSSTKLSAIRVKGNDKRNIIDKNRRKTLADKILPFDLNDSQTLAKKMPMIKNCKKIRKSFVNSINMNLNKDKCMSLPLIEGIDKNSRISGNELNSGFDQRSATSRCSLPGNKTIFFEKSSVLDLTDANIHDNNILQNNLSNAIQSLLTTSSQSKNEEIHSAGDKTINCNEFFNEASSLSFQKFNSDTIKVVEEKMQNNSKDISSTSIMLQNTPIKSFNRQNQGESSSINGEIFQDVLSPTQPAYTLTLLGVIAFVDVRSGSENRSIPIKNTLSALGAIVLEKFNMEVTHVVFRDGLKSIFERATQRGLHLVSPLWVDACRVKLARVSESLFPISNYPKAHGIGALVKSRKLKSMQPRDFEEDEMVMVARIKKRLQSATSSPKLCRAAQLPESPNTNRENINSPLFGIEHLLTPNRETNTSLVNSSFEESDREFDVPLASRMYNRFVTPSKNFSTPLRKEEHRIPLSPLVNVIRLPNIECAPETALSPTLNKKQNRRITRSQVKCLSPNKCHKKIEITERDFSINSNLSCNEVNVGCSLALQPNNTSHSQGLNISESNCYFNRLPTCLKNSVNEKTDASHKENKKKSPASTSGLTFKINDRPIQKESSLFLSNGCNSSENTIQSSLFGLSQPLSTASRKHRLHTVDCDIPEHDLIVPSTPQSVTKCQSSIYNDICVNDSTTQRMAMKNLKRKALNDDAVLPLPRKVRRCSLQLTKSNPFDSVEEELTVKNIAKSQKLTPKGRFSLIPKERGSLEEFQNKTISRRRRSRITANVLAKPVASICITSFHSGDIGSVYAIIKSLGDFKVTEEVELDTTHIVCGSERRTMNVLFGIAKGCWILDVSWLYESVELLKWAPEEPFELFNFCPGAKKHRLLKEKRSSARKPSLFFGIGRICILDSCSPKLPDMKSLLQMCGASLCSTIRSADLLIGEKKLYNSKTLQVSEKWAFDSIQKWDLQDFENYIIQ